MISIAPLFVLKVVVVLVFLAQPMFQVLLLPCLPRYLQPLSSPLQAVSIPHGEPPLLQHLPTSSLPMLASELASPRWPATAYLACSEAFLKTLPESRLLLSFRSRRRHLFRFNDHRQISPLKTNAQVVIAGSMMPCA